MKSTEFRHALDIAVSAAQGAGKLMRVNFRSPKKSNSSTQHDIKLELDVRCQKRIEKTLRSAYPRMAILGEEGVLGDTQAEQRWVVDPIDGTVNFTYGIPHCCVSIALQQRISNVAAGSLSPLGERAGVRGSTLSDLDYKTVAGVVYDPFCNELWPAIAGQPARLNGRVIHVSKRSKLKEHIVSIGFAKYSSTLQIILPLFDA